MRSLAILLSATAILPFAYNLHATTPAGERPNGGMAIGVTSAALGTPVISSGGVVTGSQFGSAPDIAPGTWIEIYGLNLSATTRIWATPDFGMAGTTAPQTIDGVSVTIGQKHAFVQYVSPGQVNALVPSDVDLGPTTITVTNAGGTTAPYPITVKEVEPALFAPATSIVNGKQYLAVFTPDGRVKGTPSNPVSPGEILTAYGIGWGPVVPTINAGTLAMSINSLTTIPQITFGTGQMIFTYYGLAPGYFGLYQFNFIVPNVNSNPASLVNVNLGGVFGTQTFYIAIQ